jgi:ABC-type Fe3+ transport system permease subunit
MVIGRTLFLTLKYGVVVGGKWQKKIYRNELPVLYWFCVICLMCALCCGLFLLIIVVKAYYFPPKLFKPPN